MIRISYEIFNNRSDFINKKFKILNIHSSLCSREFKSFFKEPFINLDSIFDIGDIFLFTKGFALSKFIHAKARKVSKSSFSMGIPSRINLWRFS